MNHDHRPRRKWPTGVERQDDLIAHLQAALKAERKVSDLALRWAVYHWRRYRILKGQLQKRKAS